MANNTLTHLNACVGSAKHKFAQSEGQKTHLRFVAKQTRLVDDQQEFWLGTRFSSFHPIKRLKFWLEREKNRKFNDIHIFNRQSRAPNIENMYETICEEKFAAIMKEEKACLLEVEKWVDSYWASRRLRLGVWRLRFSHLHALWTGLQWQERQGMLCKQDEHTERWNPRHWWVEEMCMDWEARPKRGWVV